MGLPCQQTGCLISLMDLISYLTHPHTHTNLVRTFYNWIGSPGVEGKGCEFISPVTPRAIAILSNPTCGVDDVKTSKQLPLPPASRRTADGHVGIVVPFHSAGPECVRRLDEKVIFPCLTSEVGLITE